METFRKLGEEIQEGVRRLGAARLKEYVLPRALEQAALVEKVLQHVEQLEENRDMKSILQRLDNIEAAVKDLQKTSARPQHVRGDSQKGHYRGCCSHDKQGPRGHCGHLCSRRSDSGENTGAVEESSESSG